LTEPADIGTENWVRGVLLLAELDDELLLLAKLPGNG
jgi:hypothetical protein